MHCIQIMDNKSSSILLLVCYKIFDAFAQCIQSRCFNALTNKYWQCILLYFDCNVWCAHNSTIYLSHLEWPHTIVQMNWYLFGMSSVQQCDCFMIKENKMQITSINIWHFVWYLETLNSHRIFQPRSIMILSIILFCISLSNFELHENMSETVCSMRRKPVSSWNDFNPHQ